MRESLHRCENELLTRNREYDAMCTIVEDHERDSQLREERERQINAMAAEARQRQAEATVQRDRLMMQESSLLKRIASLETQLE